MGDFHSILRIFPSHIASEIIYLTSNLSFTPEEIRIKLGEYIRLRTQKEDIISSSEKITRKDITHILLNATNGSYHSIANKIKNGYLPLPHGCRLGLCGEGVMLKNEIYNLRNINSLCIRVANQAQGCADGVFPILIENGFQNTIIIAPPGLGKTTLLRELIRKCSEFGLYVGVADERDELSGMFDGIPSFELGCRTDVISSIPKHISATALIRSMSPDILAMDEITSIQDIPAITEAIGCGVGLLTSTHGNSIEDLRKPSFKEIYDLNVFKYAVIIRLVNGQRCYNLEKLNV